MQQTYVLCAPSQPVTWHQWSACTYDSDIAIFRIDLAAHANQVPHLQTLLQDDEATRAQRFRRKEDQHSFIITRGFLRVLAGKYLNQHPVDIRFESKINKKPELQNGSEWYINVAHSGNWGLIAISRASVGTDVEKVVPDFAYTEILSQIFSVAEQEFIEASDNAQWLFYQLWTRKEALVKATGKGIDDDFARIPSIEGTHWVPSSLLGDSSAKTWLVTSFEVADNYPAAVAHQFPAENLNFYTIDSGAPAYFES